MLNDYTVQPITHEDVRPWVVNKHYAHRMPSVLHAFGLYSKCILIGVVTYGLPPCAGVAQSKNIDKLIELNRLCINNDAPKNSASFLVGNSLKMLPKPAVIISYADANQGHVGYVYQATNWIYTGTGGQKKEYIVNGKGVHDRSLGHLGITGTKERDDYILSCGGDIIEKQPKHRYVFLVGNKREKKELWKKLGWEKKGYPKGETKRYDDSAEFFKQVKLF